LDLLPIVEHLKERKNLLAFSGGVDSTALFFILLRLSIPFDIAIVHYHRRAQADEEIAYAQELALRYNKRCFVAHISLDDANFEAMAREFRYDYFETMIREHNYTNLLTAHQLDDRFEWMMMQFCKGAGCAELGGMTTITNKGYYTLVHPLLETSKAQLKKYLDENNLTYFFDHSNNDPKHTRNFFRPLIAPLMERYEKGIKKSFEFIQKDLDSYPLPTPVEIQELVAFKTSDETTTLRLISTLLKKRGKLLSQGEREEIIRQKECVISNKWVISYGVNHTIIAPFVKNSMTKKFKEECRKNGVPKLLRSYLFSAQIPLCDVHSLLDSLHVHDENEAFPLSSPLLHSYMR
jgi:tRNA(Ile)-lysidine synthase